MKILVVDDDDVTRKLLREILEKQGFQVQLASSGEEALTQIRSEVFPVVLSDIRMAEMDGMAVLREVKKQANPSMVILMTGFGSMEGAIEAIQEGAYDYISKPFKLDVLKAGIARAAKNWEALQYSQRDQVKVTPRVSSKVLLGKSPKIFEVFKTIGRVAMSSSAVLVTGESGTGKERVAQAIHDNSPRRDKSFVLVNCHAIHESFWEVEFFGEVSGTPAIGFGSRVGWVEEAHGGTLFLDEVSDIPLALQSKILRLLEEGTFKPVGSSDSRKADVRVIAATHRDLEQNVRQGRFREDLYYRLQAISIHLPPLRERMEDLKELVDHFLVKYASRNQKAISHVSEEAMKLLSHYSWPGNIRELEHAIEHAVAMTRTQVLYPEDFPLSLQKGSVRLAQADPVALGENQSSLEEMEKHHILKILQDVNFNKSKASEVLGIDRATLYRKAQRYGIDLRGKSGASSES